jgi:hypothetical protein
MSIPKFAVNFKVEPVLLGRRSGGRNEEIPVLFERLWAAGPRPGQSTSSPRRRPGAVISMRDATQAQAQVQVPTAMCWVFKFKFAGRTAGGDSDRRGDELAAAGPVTVLPVGHFKFSRD